MSDSRLRKLQRDWQETGNKEAKLAYKREQVRVGEAFETCILERNQESLVLNYSNGQKTLLDFSSMIGGSQAYILDFITHNNQLHILSDQETRFPLPRVHSITDTGSSRSVSAGTETTERLLVKDNTLYCANSMWISPNDHSNEYDICTNLQPVTPTQSNFNTISGWPLFSLNQEIYSVMPGGNTRDLEISVQTPEQKRRTLRRHKVRFVFLEDQIAYMLGEDLMYRREEGKVCPGERAFGQIYSVPLDSRLATRLRICETENDLASLFATYQQNTGDSSPKRNFGRVAHEIPKILADALLSKYGVQK